MEHIGSGICLTMICSDVCEIHNKTDVCPTSMPTTPHVIPTCPEWDVMVRIFIYLAHYRLSFYVILSSKVITLLVQQKTWFLMYFAHNVCFSLYISKMRHSYCATVQWPDALRTTQLK